MRSLLVFVPVLGAPLLHAPVLALDLFTRLKRPLDMGARVRGRRVFGDNKTVRGALCMIGGVVAAALLLSLWPTYWHALPGAVRDAGPLPLGLLVGLGVVVGELPNSFAKRQLGVAPGGRARGPWGWALSVWDQADFVPFVVLLLLPVYAMPIEWAAVALVVVAAIHFAINVVGYAIGARKTLL